MNRNIARSLFWDAVYQVLDQAIDSTGTTFTHNGDRSLRRVFATTAVLRN